VFWGHTVAELLLLLGFVMAFTYFMTMGAITFARDAGDDLAAGVAQFSFLVTGAIGAMVLGIRGHVALWNGIAALVLLSCSLLLYEWARRTIRDRGFHIAWSGDVPGELCAAGPYALIRHPAYLSYVLAFLALLVALPGFVSLAILLVNAALYAHAAATDERSLLASPLGQDYARYRRSTGMFLPRFGRS
jgi:protein-S-isoprenylcysteine O-methyltransferase Ste14